MKKMVRYEPIQPVFRFFLTCMAFAGALSRRKTQIMMCPAFPEPVDVKIVFVTGEKDSTIVRQLSVDPDLAGVSVSMHKREPAKVAQLPDGKARKRRSKGVAGVREGILFQLSGRETEVLCLIAEGFTNKEIARVLKVSQNRIKSHVVSIFNKLGINDRTQAAVWAAQNQLV